MPLLLVEYNLSADASHGSLKPIGLSMGVRIDFGYKHLGRQLLELFRLVL